MRVMMKVTIPTESGNSAIKDGVLTKVMGEFSKEWRPEALYFTTEHGLRTATTVFDLKDTAQIVQISEPFFMSMNAKITWQPCMNQEDLGRGMQAFMKK